jgi:hypothetical protein
MEGMGAFVGKIIFQFSGLQYYSCHCDGCSLATAPSIFFFLRSSSTATNSFQCKAVARRAGVGISRGGGGINHCSGGRIRYIFSSSFLIYLADIFICFSTAPPLTTPPPYTGKTMAPVATYVRVSLLGRDFRL